MTSRRPVLMLAMASPAPYAQALEAAGLSERFEVVSVPPGHAPPAEHLAEVEVLVSMGPAAGMLRQMPKLRWIQSLTAGVDHWLARDDLRANLTLTAARGTHRVQMPENILGALFHITKPYHAAAVDQRQSKWSRKIGVPLAGKTLAILGLGAIGTELARKAAALEMTVIGTKRVPGPMPNVEAVYGADQTDAVLERADFVLLLLPLTPATESFMNAERLARMRKDAWLLNFGRGGLIDDAALIGAVKSGTIAGAVLDVFRTEPLPTEHPFWTTPGIVVLPHIGGLHPTRDSVVAELMVRNAAKYLAGEPLLEVVDRTRGY